MTVAWREAELKRIDETQELLIAVIRADGTSQREVPIWVVRVGPEVYVRTWYRRGNGWFGHAVNSQRARIRILGTVVELVVEDVGSKSAKVRTGVDNAYRSKYGHYGHETVDRMMTEEAAATTLRLMKAHTM